MDNARIVTILIGVGLVALLLLNFQRRQGGTVAAPLDESNLPNSADEYVGPRYIMVNSPAYPNGPAAANPLPNIVAGGKPVPVQRYVPDENDCMKCG